eukprot:gene7586-740_t
MEVLERLSLYCLIILMYLALYFVVVDLASTARTAFSLCLVLVNGLFITFMILQLLCEYVFNMMRAMDTNQDGLVTRKDIEEAYEKADGWFSKWQLKTFASVDGWIRADPNRLRRFAKFMPYGGYGPVREDLVKDTRGEIGFGASSVWAKSITGALARERMHRKILADQVDTSIDGRPPSARRSATATRPISRNSSSRGSNRAEAPAARRLSFGLLGGNKVAPSPTKDEAADEMVLKSLQVSDEEGTNQTNEGQIRPQVLPLSPSRSKSQVGDKSDPSSLWRSLSGAALRSLSSSAVREEVQLPNATDP